MCLCKLYIHSIKFGAMLAMANNLQKYVKICPKTADAFLKLQCFRYVADYYRPNTLYVFLLFLNSNRIIIKIILTKN